LGGSGKCRIPNGLLVLPEYRDVRVLTKRV
jgi:hypothetical protein